ncbi:hypothetical protein A2U01_0012295, partial [Trifolium medium]|nr:hypothetical protein [Trifolium medium]
MQKDYEELAATVMNVVDLVVHKTNERIESATDVLKGVLKHVINDEGEISWPPQDPQALKSMEMAKEDGDKPGLEAMLQK